MATAVVTPILILAFNRPELVQKLLDRLREIEPTQLFFAVDGPRADRPSDAELVAATQACAKLIDWPCEVRTLFRETNLGCGRAVSSALSWFFSNVERGIILEDDVLPRLEFFPYCEELLERYEDDRRVFAISGSNFVPAEHISTNGTYRFSHITHVWGWATWRRSWVNYRYDIQDWRKRLPVAQRWERTGRNLLDFAFWSLVFTRASRGRPDTWDHQWTLAQMSEGALTATANVNLVDNIGFGVAATHTNDKPAFCLPTSAIQFPLQHPPVMDDRAADLWCSRAITTDIAKRAIQRRIMRC